MARGCQVIGVSRVPAAPPPLPPVGARSRCALLIGCLLGATSRNRGCVTGPGHERRGRSRLRAGEDDEGGPATAPRPAVGPQGEAAPLRAARPRPPVRPLTLLKMPTHSTRGMPGAPLCTTAPGMPRGGAGLAVS